MSMTAIILAAGKSTRMKSKRPKPLHEVCGRPMLEYVLRACYEAGCTRVIVVVGHGKDEVIAQFGDDQRIIWVEQTEQLGTGHAVMVCEDELQEGPRRCVHPGRRWPADPRRGAADAAQGPPRGASRRLHGDGHAG